MRNRGKYITDFLGLGVGGEISFFFSPPLRTLQLHPSLPPPSFPISDLFPLPPSSSYSSPSLPTPPRGKGVWI